MSDVQKIFWTLRALGRSEEASRLREDFDAARGGAPDAKRRLGETLEQLRWALDALGPSDDARRRRDAALAAHAIGVDLRAVLALPPLAADTRAAPTAAAPAPADASGGPPAAAPAMRADPPKIAALRRRLAAEDALLSGWRAKLRSRRARRIAVVAAVLLGGGLAVAVPSVMFRAEIARGWARGREHVATTWRRVTALRTRGDEASVAPAAPPTPRASAPGAKARTRSATARGASQAGGADAPAPGPDASKSPPRNPAPPIDPGAIASLWRAETWRMTVDDVLRTFPGATRVTSARGPDGLDERAVAGAVTLAGHPWTARFRFDDSGRLAEIQLFPLQPGAAATRARERLAAALAAGNGPPRTEGAKGRATWSTEGGVAELRDQEMAPGQVRVFAVDLKHGDMRPLPAREVTLTLRPPEVSDH